MDWLQAITHLVSAVIGGLLVIAGESLRNWHAIKLRRADTVVLIYTDFLVAFQTALHRNELYWRGIAASYKDNVGISRPETERVKKAKAEHIFREALWKLRLRERDAAQQKRIEELAGAFDFDDDPEVSGGLIPHALTYDNTASALRGKVNTIVNEMQRLHRRPLRIA